MSITTEVRMHGADSRRFAMGLLNAERTEIVADLLEEIESSQEGIGYKPLGGSEATENNYSIVHNQAANGMAALSELVVNSVDGILMKDFWLNDIQNPDAYQTAQDAVDGFVDMENAHIEIAADGLKPHSGNILNLTLSDTGCGGRVGEAEDSFFGLLTPGRFKQAFAFLQGGFGMGGTASLQFCGEAVNNKRYKFIATSSYDDPNHWSWSIIRLNTDSERYEYLTVDGELPTFRGEFNGQDYGTVVRLYDYKPGSAKGKINSEDSFRYRLERYMVDPVIPIDLTDHRYDSTHQTYVTNGVLGKVNDPKHADAIDKHQHLRLKFNSDLIGEVPVHIVTLKHESEMDTEAASRRWADRFGFQKNIHTKMAVLYTINGQTHASEGRTFLKNRCGFTKVGDDTLVIIDFSERINSRNMGDLFPASRDRLKDTDEAKQVRDELADFLKNNDYLVDEEDRRRSALSSVDNSEQTRKTIADVIRENPDIEHWLKTGTKPVRKTYTGKKDEQEYDAPFIPTKMVPVERFSPSGDHVLWGRSDPLPLEIPLNRQGKVRFEIDAPNDYFERHDRPGSLQIEPREMYRAQELKNGLLTVTLHPQEDSEVGDRDVVLVTVTRPNDQQSLVQNVLVEYTEPEESKKRNSTPSPKSVLDMEMPQINRIYEEDWNNEFDEDTILTIYPSSDGSISGLTLNINIDSAPLTNFIAQRNIRENWKENVVDKYELATSLYAIGQYTELQSSGFEEELNELEPGVVGMVERCINGIGQMVMPSLYTEEEIDRISD